MRAFLMLALLISGCGGSARPPHEGKSLAQLRQMLQAADDRGSLIQGAIGLGVQGPAAEEAVPELLPLLEHADATVRESATNALGRIASPRAVPGLLGALNDPQWTVRRQAVIALGAIGEPSAAVAVEKLTKDPDTLVRKAAQEALTKLRTR